MSGNSIIYSVYRIPRGNGRGGIADSQRNISLPTIPRIGPVNQAGAYPPTHYMEYYSVKHANNKDYWLIAIKDSANSSLASGESLGFYAYHISDTGIAPPVYTEAPVACVNGATQNIYNVGVVLGSDTTSEPRSSLAISPSGNKVGFKGFAQIYQYFTMDFDKETGVFSNLTGVLPSFRQKWEEGPMSASFSPDDSLLYLSFRSNGQEGARISQLDLTGNPLNQYQTVYEDSSASDSVVLRLFLTPNQKIWLGREGDSSFSHQFLYPNRLGASCSIVTEQVSIAPTVISPAFMPMYSEYYQLDYAFDLDKKCGDTLRVENLTSDFQRGDSNVFVHYVWDYGDGSELDTQRNGLHVYEESGTYRVVLSGIRPSGGRINYSQEVDIVLPTKAAYRFDTIEQNCSGQVYRLIDESSRRDSVYYELNDVLFTDSILVLDSVGVYELAQYAIDLSTGCQSIHREELIFSSKPEVSYELSADTACLPYELKVENNSKYDSMGRVEFEWKLNGVKVSTSAADFQTSLDSIGSYELGLKVDNGQGCADSLKEFFTLIGRPEGVVTEVVDTLCNKRILDLRLSDTEWVKGWAWNQEGFYQDSMKSKTKMTFDSAGKKEYGVVLWNGYCADTQNFTIEVNFAALPEVNVELSDSILCGPDSIAISSQAINTARVETWTGDSLLVEGISQWKLKDTGYHEMMQIGINEEGCRDTAIKRVYVSPVPKVDFGLSDSVGCQFVSYQFEDLSEHGTSWTWDFGTGEGRRRGRAANYVYRETGFYDIGLIVQNAYCSDSLFREDFIEVLAAPEAKFEMSSSRLCEGEALEVSNQTSGVVEEWWYEIDGVNKGQEGVYQMGEENVYVVGLHAIGPTGCRVSQEDSFKVYAKAEGALLLDSVSYACGLENHYWRWEWSPEVGTLGENTLLWRSDSSRKAQKNLIIDTAQSSYNLALALENGVCQNEVDTLIAVSVRKPIRHELTVAEGLRSCVPFHFSAALKGSNYDAVKWELGGANVQEGGEEYEGTLASAGFEDLKIVLTSQEGCQDSSVQKLRAFQAVKAEIKPHEQEGCSPFEVNFQADTSLADTVWQYSWQIGSREKTGSKVKVNFDQKRPKKEEVMLKVSNGYCEDSAKSWVSTINYDSSKAAEEIRGIAYEDASWKISFADLAYAEAIEVEQKAETWQPLGETQEREWRIVAEEGASPKAYRYRIKDGCGGKSGYSEWSRNMVLSGKNESGRTLLEWNRYGYWEKGMAKQEIWRSEDGVYWELEAEVPENAERYEKAEQMAEERYFQVRAKGADGGESSSNILEIRSAFRYYIPNGFTPDGDGINDRFKVSGRGIASASLRIYNRRGAKIYDGDGLAGWDGKEDGARSPEGVYIYIIELKDKNGKSHEFKGNVSLLRP